MGRACLSANLCVCAYVLCCCSSSPARRRRGCSGERRLTYYLVDTGLDEKAILAALGEGLAPEIDLRKLRSSDLDPADVVSMVLLPSDFAAMQPGSLVCKLGSTFPHIQPGCKVFPVPDLHAPFCNEIFQLRTEFTNFLGGDDSPLFVV